MDMSLNVLSGWYGGGGILELFLNDCMLNYMPSPNFASRESLTLGALRG